jgi:RNA polymerase sigma-70 factor (ECF subfamily)
MQASMQDGTVIKFQQGDKKSYKILFNMLYPAMCLFAKKFINDYDNAEDIAQDVFIELWNQRAKFESIDQIKAFLYLSVKNKCLNFKKHLVVREKYANSALEDYESIFEEYVLETEVVQNINTAINNLPEQRKQIIILSVQGLKNNEIAEDMQISINTVKLQKKIAYQQLREKLGNSLFSFLLLIC